MDLLDQLQPEHLDGEQRRMADAIGIEAFKTLVKMYAGCESSPYLCVNSPPGHSGHRFLIRIFNHRFLLK